MVSLRQEVRGDLLKLCLVGGDELLQEANSLGRSVRVVAAAKDAAELQDNPEVSRADAIIVDGNMDGALDAGAEIAGNYRDIPVFIASEDTGIDLYRRASRKGLKGVLRRPLDREEIEEVLEEFAGDGRTEPRYKDKRGYEPEDDEEDYMEAKPRRRRNGVVRQEVITVYSPKGGVGKTTLVCNLAAVYAKHVPDLRVVILDFDSHARVVSLLQMNTSVSIENWFDTLEQHFEHRLALYPLGKQGGIYVLPGIRRPINKDLLDEELVTDVINYMRRNADVILIDCGPDFEDATVLSLEMATQVLMVATMDVQTLRDMYRLPKDLALTRTDEKKIRAVLNRVPKKPPFSVRQVREWLPWELVAQIPEDDSVGLLQNQGRIPVLERNSPFASSVLKLAAKMTPALEDAILPRKRGLFAWLFGRKGGAD